ncbi:T9SS type A sorting domain-containing protein [uncultured Psychroserpens sp.]|uniref:T9SS type A sorting domain-containing protein n=1 Tax=uncultured Psychroserpens sp. TaxID=255436 RepID=UPI0026062EFC|nr:T9SS type A sorting domain-containing protein [uncultured Psychroserpens sp.]
MIKKLLSLSLLFTSSIVFGQIVFQETVIDTTNTFQLGVSSPTGTYSRDAVQLADMDGDGDADLIPKSNPLMWIENTNGQGTLSIQHIVDDNVNGVNAIKTADIDSDGDIDIIIAENASPMHIIAWYENTDGAGTFSAKQVITTQVDNPAMIYISDIDGDTDLDILSSSRGDGIIAWYENTDGQAAFGPQQIITTASFSSTTQYIEIVAGDLDDDDDNDIMFASKGSPDQIVYWVENTDGQGNFGSPQQAFDVFGGMYTVSLGDLDNDGDLDAYGQNVFDGLISFANDGSGNFSFMNSFSSSYDLFIGFAQWFDVDGDGDLDMFGFGRNDDFDISTNEAGMVWFENTDGQGTYSDEQFIRNINFRTFSSRLAVADMDGDDLIDLVVNNVDGYELSWNKNQSGSAFFEDSQEIIIDLRELRDVISADLDNDGDQDIIYGSSDSKLSWYENLDALGNFGPQQLISSSAFRFNSVVAKDLDDDDDIDLVVATQDGDKLLWYENDGSGQFSVGSVISDITVNPQFVSVFDVDGDDDNDVVCLDNLGDRVVWYENTDGLGNFGSEQVIIDTIDNIKPFDYGDIDADGDFDLVINQPFSWLANDGSGNFSAPQVIPSSNEDAIKLSDIDGDGDLDIFTSDPIGWYENEDGQGTFGAFQVVYGGDNVFPNDFLEFTDIDNDGDPDVVMSLFTGVNSDRIIYFKNYNGVFGNNPITLGDTNQGLSDFHIADLNGDNNNDVLYITAESLSNSDAGKVSWFKNLGVLSNLISGTVTYDSDGDGCDGSDAGISNVWIGSGSSFAAFSTFTNDDGTFAIDVGQGDFTTLLTPSLPSYFTVSPPIHTTNFEGDNEIDNAANFCVTSTGTANDLTISIYPISEPRPGFDTSYEIVYTNIGTTVLSGTVEMVFDVTKMQYLTASQAPSSQSGDLLSFDFSNIAPFENRSIIVEFNVFTPPTTNINDVINTVVSVNPIAGDNTENDNTYNLSQTVVGSYDPNDITVLEGEQILLEQTDDYLHYVIRFQNTGTAEAINVRITNIIDPKLEWFTLQIESMSHNGHLIVEDGIQAVFTFDNILLPSSSQNEAESNGYIAYKIKPKQDASLGDIFYNDASIFFDFNPAIVTNTVSTEVVDALSVDDIEIQDVDMFPNPAVDIVSIRSNVPVKTITVTDINGRNIKHYKNTDVFSVLDLTTGIYFIKIDMGSKSVVKKLLKH